MASFESGDEQHNVTDVGRLQHCAALHCAARLCLAAIVTPPGIPILNSQGTMQFPYLFWRVEADLLQDALQDGVQPPRANVVHAPVDLPPAESG